MNQKGFTPIIIFFIVAVGLIGGGLFVSKKIDLSSTDYQTNPQASEQPSANFAKLNTAIPTPSVSFKPKPLPTTITSLKPTPKVSTIPTSTPFPTSTPVSTPTSTNITISVKGQVYSDANCNGAKDGNENGIANATVNILAGGSPDQYGLLATVITDSSGSYTYSTQIPINTFYWVKPSTVAPEGHKIYYSNTPDAYLNKDTPTWPEINLPVVSIDNLGNCGPY